MSAFLPDYFDCVYVCEWCNDCWTVHITSRYIDLLYVHWLFFCCCKSLLIKTDELISTLINSWFVWAKVVQNLKTYCQPHLRSNWLICGLPRMLMIPQRFPSGSRSQPFCCCARNKNQTAIQRKCHPSLQSQHQLYNQRYMDNTYFCIPLFWGCFPGLG